MFGLAIVREKTIQQMADDFTRVHRETVTLRAELERARLALQEKQHTKREESIRDHLKQIRGGEEIKRHEAKHAVSKEIILEMREAIKGAVLSIRDLAGRNPNQVTAAHLHDLAAEADKLVQYTSLPRR